jgi:hypothetical protein
VKDEDLKSKMLLWNTKQKLAVTNLQVDTENKTLLEKVAEQVAIIENRNNYIDMLNLTLKNTREKLRHEQECKLEADDLE